MATVSSRPMTAEEFFEWCHRPENADRRFELERGEVVEMPQPGERPGAVCANVAFVLGAYVRQRRKGYLCVNDTGVVWERNPDTVRGPDAFLYDEARRYEELALKYSERVPCLVVEVLSPTDRWGKVTQRITQFLQRGVAMVWLIDPEGRTVTVYRPDQLPQVLEEGDELAGIPALSDFRCSVADFFLMPDE